MNIKHLLPLFGISETEVTHQIYKSAWDVDGRYVLKMGGELATLEKSIALSDLLLKEGLPVPGYVRTPDGAPFAWADGAYYVLMKKIDGSHIDPYKGDPYSNGVTLGRITAKLHLALDAVSDKIECPDGNYMRELDDWILSNLEGMEPAREVVDYCRRFGPLYRTLPRQLIHRDVHTGNLLFRDERFVGYLDFDNSQINARLHDLCYLGATALVGNYQKKKRLLLWRELFRGILFGYNELLRLTEDELKAIPHMFVFIELTFAAFFAKTGQQDIATSCIAMMEWLYHNRDSLGKR